MRVVLMMVFAVLGVAGVVAVAGATVHQPADQQPLAPIVVQPAERADDAEPSSGLSPGPPAGPPDGTPAGPAPVQTLAPVAPSVRLPAPPPAVTSTRVPPPPSGGDWDDDDYGDDDGDYDDDWDDDD